MTQLPLVPFFAPGAVPMFEVERPDTTRADTEAALAAWETAIEAIMAAWKVTPSHMLRTRMTVSRKSFNQGIAHAAAEAMQNAAAAALNSMDINARARRDGISWAAATDAEAVAREGSA